MVKYRYCHDHFPRMLHYQSITFWWWPTHHFFFHMIFGLRRQMKGSKQYELEWTSFFSIWHQWYSHKKSRKDRGQNEPQESSIESFSRRVRLLSLFLALINVPLVYVVFTAALVNIGANLRKRFQQLVLLFAAFYLEQINLFHQE